ncbi:MAG: septum formation protein Maf [bacterium]|nr:septum formation protein Maf [bacterium]
MVLASQSPRRAELLRLAGLTFEVCPPGDVEAGLAARLAATGVLPGDYARALARAKAADVAVHLPGRLVLGADTIVVVDGDILEKPQDEADAARLLARLSGRRHTVITAIALCRSTTRNTSEGGGVDLVLDLCAAESTAVEFLPLGAGAIARYIATGEPLDKAGAYGIQGYGALMVRRVEGCYFNVMGLPLARLGLLLGQALAGDRKETP